jgi:hypothetical protein
MFDFQGMFNNIALFTVVIIAVSLIFTVVVIRMVRKMAAPNRDLITTGETAQATILKFWDTGMTINDNPMVGFLLEVNAPNRTPYQVETKHMISRLNIGQLRPGAVIAVKVDPANPQRIAFMPA